MFQVILKLQESFLKNILIVSVLNEKVFLFIENSTMLDSLVPLVENKVLSKGILTLKKKKHIILYVLVELNSFLLN